MPNEKETRRVVGHQDLELRLKHAELDLKQEQIRSEQAGRKHRFWGIVVPILTALLAGAGTLLVKGIETNEKLAEANRQIEVLKARKVVNGVSPEELFRKTAELNHVKAELTKALQVRDELEKRMQTSVNDLQDILATLVRVNLEINQPDNKLEEARREALAAQQKLKEFQEQVSSSSQDDIFKNILSRLMVSDVAVRGQEASQKATELTKESYEIRLKAVSELLKEAFAKHLPRYEAARGLNQPLKALPVTDQE